METTTMLMPKVEIIEFQEKYASDFARLNYVWLEKYFTVEEHDIEQLENANEYIVKPGGEILLALDGDLVVGTVALVKMGDDAFEVAKMAVSESHQGLKIGYRLMLAAIDYSIKVGKKKLILESNTKLPPALNLYIKVGFRVIPQDPNTLYSRSNIRMELKLQ
ncbi:MAG: GNAT family N-acetyltransferase [bacterium]|nr:GNAT family N-acetyltransferase [bacterium]